MISEVPQILGVCTTGGQLLFAGSYITREQGVWQSIGRRVAFTEVKPVLSFVSQASTLTDIRSIWSSLHRWDCQ